MKSSLSLTHTQNWCKKGKSFSSWILGNPLCVCACGGCVGGYDCHVDYLAEFSRNCFKLMKHWTEKRASRLLQLFRDLGSNWRRCRRHVSTNTDSRVRKEVHKLSETIKWIYILSRASFLPLQFSVWKLSKKIEMSRYNTGMMEKDDITNWGFQLVAVRWTHTRNWRYTWCTCSMNMLCNSHVTEKISKKQIFKVRDTWCLVVKVVSGSFVVTVSG